MSRIENIMIQLKYHIIHYQIDFVEKNTLYTQLASEALRMVCDVAGSSTLPRVRSAAAVGEGGEAGELASLAGLAACEPAHSRTSLDSGIYTTTKKNLLNYISHCIERFL